MAILTHSAVREAGIVDTGTPTTVNSLGPCNKLFIPFDEGSGTTISDALTRMTFNMASLDGSVTWGGGTDVTGETIPVNMASWSLGSSPLTTTVAPSTGTLPQPGEKAWLFCWLQHFAGFASPFGGLRYGPTSGDGDYMDLAYENKALFECYLNGVANLLESTEQLPPADNTSYMLAAACTAPANGQRVFKGWIDSSPVGGSDQQPSAIVSSGEQFYDWTPANEMSISAIGGTMIGMMATYVFADGLPSDIPEALSWMKEQAIAGNKVSWPGWMTIE